MFTVESAGVDPVIRTFVPKLLDPTIKSSSIQTDEKQVQDNELVSGAEGRTSTDIIP